MIYHHLACLLSSVCYANAWTAGFHTPEITQELLLSTLPCHIFELPLSWSQSNKSTFSPDQPCFGHLQNPQLTFQFSVLDVSFWSHIHVSPCFFSREYPGIMLQDSQQPLHAWNDQQPLHGRVKNNPYLFAPLLCFCSFLYLWLSLFYEFF